MGVYSLDRVIRDWEQERLTIEQTIGQVLLLLQKIEGRLRVVERRLGNDLGEPRSRREDKVALNRG